MEISENELEQMIFSSTQSKIRDKGLKCYDHQNLFRQLNLGSDYGRADLVGLDLWKKSKSKDLPRRFVATVYELKKEKVGTATLLQAARYGGGLQRFAKDRYGQDIIVKTVLIGSEVDTHCDFIHLLYPLNFYLKVYTYSFGIDGLLFNEVDPFHYKDSLHFGTLENINFRKIHRELYSPPVYIEPPF